MADDNTNDGAHDGSDVKILDPTDSERKLERGELYLGQVRDVREYGVFVAFTPQEMSDVSGLAHETNLPELTKPRDFSVAEHVVVRIDAITDDGPQLVLEYGEAVNPNEQPVPKEYPAMSENPDPSKAGTEPHAVDKQIQRVQRKTAADAARADGAGQAVSESGDADAPADAEQPHDAADAPTTAELGEVVDELWDIRGELESLKEAHDGDDTDGTPVPDNGASFAENPLKDTALDLLRLAETGEMEAETVRKEKTADGGVRFEVAFAAGENSEADQ